MAKKKTGSRKTASRGARKGARKTARKSARAARPTAPYVSATLEGKGKGSKVTWNAGPAVINFTPLKAILQAHIDRLSRVAPSDEVARTMNLLETTKRTLGEICGMSMEIPTRSQL